MIISIYDHFKTRIMNRIKKLLMFVMAVSFLGLMSFTVSFDQSDATSDQLNSATTATVAVEGKWGKGRKKVNDNGSITTTYKCIKSGTDCVVGTIAKITIYPIGD